VSDVPCQFLPWDSDFFGRRIARANFSRLTQKLIEDVYAWCEEHSIECLYLLADADDPDTIRLAEDHTFRLVEVRVTMERWLKDWNPTSRPKASAAVRVRPATEADIPVMRLTARNSYVDSRFYFDTCFPESLCQEYYATWIENSVKGYADMVLVAEAGGKYFGYITGKLEKEHLHAQFVLIGVEENARRFGVGQELFRCGLDWFVNHGAEYVWVATQGRNLSAQRLIYRDGFLTRQVQLYYHKWFSSCPSSFNP